MDGESVTFYQLGTGQISLDTALDFFPYIEVQMQGQVSLSDVASVVDHTGVITADQRAKLAARGIQVVSDAPAPALPLAPAPAPVPIAAPAPTPAPVSVARTRRTRAPAMTPEAKAAAAEAKRIAKAAEKAAKDAEKAAEKAAKAEAARVAKAEAKAKRDAEKAAEKAAKAEATRIAKAETKAIKAAEKAAEKARKAAEKADAAKKAARPAPARKRKASAPVTVSTGGSDGGRGILKAQEIERQIYTQRFESAYAYAPDGTLVLSKDGERYAVKFEFEEYEKLTGTIFTHNHPRGWDVEANDPRRIGNSFSLADVRVASAVKVRELRAVTPAHTYRMVEPAGGWPNFNTVINPLYEQRAREITRELQRLVTSGAMSAEQAESEHYHRVWSAVTSELGIPYYKETHGYS
jgi:flagellar biosynthesis GTPase FlhF